MANYYTTYVWYSPKLTKAEQKWFTEELKRRAATLADPDDDANADYFDWEFFSSKEGAPPDRLKLHNHEGGEGNVANLLQTFLKRFHPDKVVAFELAQTCDKDRSDGFGGGAVVISAKRIQWLFTYPWVQRRLKGKQLWGDK